MNGILMSPVEQSQISEVEWLVGVDGRIGQDKRKVILAIPWPNLGTVMTEVEPQPWTQQRWQNHE